MDLAKGEATAEYRHGGLEILDYSGEVGCCFTCPEQEEGCLCPECKCTRCSLYIKEYFDEKGHCRLSLEREDKWEKVSTEIDAWLKETEKAYLVVIDGEEFWFPKSLTKIAGSKKESFIEMPKWLAVEKGLYELDESDTWKGD